MAILDQHCTGPWQDPTCGAWECPWGKELGLIDVKCPECSDEYWHGGYEFCGTCEGSGWVAVDPCDACGRKDIE